MNTPRSKADSKIAWIRLHDLCKELRNLWHPDFNTVPMFAREPDEIKIECDNWLRIFCEHAETNPEMPEHLAKWCAARAWVVASLAKESADLLLDYRAPFPEPLQALHYFLVVQWQEGLRDYWNQKAAQVKVTKG